MHYSENTENGLEQYLNKNILCTNKIKILSQFFEKFLKSGNEDGLLMCLQKMRSIHGNMVLAINSLSYNSIPDHIVSIVVSLERAVSQYLRQHDILYSNFSQNRNTTIQQMPSLHPYDNLKYLDTFASKPSTLDTFVNEEKTPAKTESKPILVLFYTTWCGYSKPMITLFHQWKERMTDDMPYKIRMVDCDEEKQVAQIFEIKTYPTIYLVKGNNKIMFENQERNIDNLQNFVYKNLKTIN